MRPELFVQTGRCSINVCPRCDAERTRSGVERLREQQRLARARHIRPVAIEVGDEALEILALHGARERGLIGKFVHRQMNGRIAETPEPSSLSCAKAPHRIRQMLILIPFVERRALRGIGDGADDEEGGGHEHSP